MRRYIYCLILCVWFCSLSVLTGSRAQSPLTTGGAGPGRVAAGSSNSATKVQTKHLYPASAGATMPLAYTSNVVNGNLLVVMGSFNRTSDFTGAVSDTRGSTWTITAVGDVAGPPHCFNCAIDFFTVGDNVAQVVAWAFANGSGADTITMNDTTANGYGDGGIWISEWSAPAGFAATPLDIISTTHATVSSPTLTPTTSSFSPTQRDLVIVLFADEHTSEPSDATAGAGYTLDLYQSGHIDGEEYNLGVNAGSFTASFTLPATTGISGCNCGSETWTIVVVCFKIN